MRISVVTCVLNGQAGLQRCIDSVRQQDHNDIEHVIIDGGSTDGTHDILRKNGLPFVSGKDRGIYDAFSKGVAQSTGEAIHLLNADDWYTDAYSVSASVSELSAKNLDICHSKVAHLDHSGRTLNVIGQQATRRQLLRSMCVTHSSMFIRRSVHDRFGNYSYNFRIAGDYEFLLRAWGHVAIGYLDRVTVNMTIGGASMARPHATFREQAAAAMLHGVSPIVATLHYHRKVIKHAIATRLRYRR